MAVIVKIISNNAAWIYARLPAGSAVVCCALPSWPAASASRLHSRLEREPPSTARIPTLRWALLILLMGATYFVGHLSVAGRGTDHRRG